MIDISKATDWTSLGELKLTATGSLIFSPVLAFFGVPIFWVLLLIVCIDFLTGVWKAKLSNKLCSSKFSNTINRGLTYIIIFVMIHAVAGTATADLVKTLLTGTEYTLFMGYCIKEILSVLENLKAIQVVTGAKENWIIDMAVKKLGLDLEKILKDTGNNG